jgi:hypothetical protein
MNAWANSAFMPVFDGLWLRAFATPRSLAYQF